MPVPASNIASDSDGLANVPLVAHLPEDKPLDEQQKMFDFASARTHLKRIIDDWHTEVEDTEVRRKERKLELDVEGMRQKGELAEDETIIPIRVIDTNIQREQPPYINYLKNSRRIAIFECLDDPSVNVDQIEGEFTKKASYTAWEVPHFKCLDGSQLHGWDAVEVVFDAAKPGNFAIEHIGHDKLLFPRSAIDLQQCPRIIRCFDVTFLQLQSWVDKYGFNKEQIDLIRNARKDTQKENETIRIYRVYFKATGVVQVAWFTTEYGCEDWLKSPIPHYCGIDEETVSQTFDMMGMPQQSTQWVPKPLDTYPIFILPYREIEEQKIVDHKGRGFLDSYKQEAQTALWSSFINGMTRASNVFASPDQEDGTGVKLKELNDVKLTPGRILSRPMKFWAPPYPDPIVLRTLQHAEVANSDETNQVNFAAMNREDSRKTAKEIGAAQQQQTLLNSVQLTLFSTFIRQVYSFAWQIVQSQALQNKIRFLLVNKPQINPMTGQPLVDPNTGQPITALQNDVDRIKLTYAVRAAGDVDVIQKDELIQRMQQDFQLVLQTALKDQFIIDYIKLKYPDKADEYTQILGQSAQMNKLTSALTRMTMILNGAIKDNPDMLAQLSDQDRSSIAQLMQESQQLTGQPVTE